MKAMLEGVVTGYETRFDFPVRATPPVLSYMLATVPRTGSTFVSHLLWRTGCLGAPLEYLNFQPGSPYGAAHGDSAAEERLWRRALARRTSPNGVFGIKCFPMPLQELDQRNPPLLASVMSTLLPRGRRPMIVYLRRRDRVAHRISYARATLSGVWRQEQERDGREEPAYSEEALAAAERWIRVQEQIWEQMFADLRIVPLTLWYEDAVADPAAAALAVAGFLGVPLSQGAEVEVPPIRRQSQAGAKDWAERHATSKGG
jgi:LPS sulfotransferase NodH